MRKSGRPDLRMDWHEARMLIPQVHAVTFPVESFKQGALAS
jgi:hypothetical protein